MATRIITTVGSVDQETIGASIAVEVQEDFDRTLDLCVPLSQPSSALEARENMTFHERETGERIWMRPEIVAYIQEIN